MNTQTTHDCVDARDSIGQQLLSARIAKGYSVADVATRLRVLVSVVDDIERDDYGRLGAPIFVKGHLSSYCRLVGVEPPEPTDGVAGVAAAMPPLCPMTRTSRMQRLLESSARSLVYVVLSASIGIPVVWFALNAPTATTATTASLTRLDQLPREIASVEPTVPARNSADPTTAQDGPVPAVVNEPPVVASLTGFYGPASAHSDVNSVDSVAGIGGSVLLHFRERSWLEVLSPSGERVDEALVPAGQDRRYALEHVGHVTLGNAAGVDVNVDDTPVDVSAYRRANVARFKVSSDGQLAPSDG